MKILVNIFLLFFLVTSAEAASELWKAWMYITDSPTITLAWDPVEGAAGYEVKTTSLYPTQEWIKAVATTQTTITRPRSGMFKFAVRACESTTSCTGDWAYSDGPTAVITVNDTLVLQAWGVFWRLSPVIIH